MTHRLRVGRRRIRVLLAVSLLALVAGSGSAIVPTPAGAEDAPLAVGTPTLNLRAGQTLEGTVQVVAEPSAENDPVVRLTVDGDAVDAGKTAGTAHFAFDMGGNGTEARYHNFITVNGRTAEADRVYFPDIPGGRNGTLDLPGDWLHTGVNTITVHAGANCPTVRALAAPTTTTSR
jgi:hypothetical protein